MLNQNLTLDSKLIFEVYTKFLLMKEKKFDMRQK